MLLVVCWMGGDEGMCEYEASFLYRVEERGFRGRQTWIYIMSLKTLALQFWTNDFISYILISYILINFNLQSGNKNHVLIVLSIGVCHMYEMNSNVARSQQAQKMVDICLLWWFWASYISSLSLGRDFFYLKVNIEQNHMHRLSILRGDSKHFCPLHLGIGVPRESKVQSSTG